MTRTEALRRQRAREFDERVRKAAPALHAAVLYLFKFVDGNGEPANDLAKTVPPFLRKELRTAESVRVNIPSSDLRAWRKLLDDLYSGESQVEEG